MKNASGFATLLCAVSGGDDIPHSLTCNAVTCKDLVRVHGGRARDIHQKFSTGSLVAPVLAILVGAAAYLLAILIRGNSRSSL